MDPVFPFFVGDTEDGERISLYQIGNEIHIKLPNGELWALSPGYWIDTYHDNLSSIMEIAIKSKQWTGIARGGKALIEAAEPLQR